jgi:magnesium transporter
VPTSAPAPEAAPVPKATGPEAASGPTDAAPPNEPTRRARPHIDPADDPDAARSADDRCIRVVEWHNGAVREWQGFGDLRLKIRDPHATVWVDMTDPAPEQVSEIARVLGLHPLIAEDILEGNQRAKIEVPDQLCHIVMFALEYKGEMLRSEIDFVLGDQFLLTVHEANWDPFATTHLRDGVEPIMRRGPDHLLWALVDAVVDSYFPFIDKMADEIDEIEDQVVLRADSRVLARLFQLKKDLLIARRAAAPVREIFNGLTNRDLALIDQDEVIYFRDVYDHLIRLTDELDNYRELVSSALDVYLSTVNNNLSVIMKRLTGVTVILAGVGAIAGIFGMSEAGAALGGAEAGGFWLITAITFAIAAAAAAFLRRIGWI